MNRLNKHIAILILSLPLLLIGCTVLDEETPIGEDSGKSYIAINVKGLQTRSASSVLMTMRLLVFSSNGGECLGNKLFVLNSPEYSMPLSKNVYKKNIDVYVVVNEEGYCSTLSSTGETLASRLQAISVRSDKESFLDLMNEQLEYNPNNSDVTTAEPAFVMYTQKENILVDKKSTSPKDPFFIQLSPGPYEQVDRSMAKITIEGIEGIADSDVAKVFVTDMRIVKIPVGYSLSGKNNNATQTSGSIDRIGNVTSKLGYDRVWKDNKGKNGEIIGYYSGTISETKKIGGRYYRVHEDKKDDSWDFLSNWNDEPCTYETENGQVKKPKKSNVNNFNSLCNSLKKKADLLSPSSVKLAEMNQESVVPTATPWRISLGKSVYVPENISQSKEYATQIVVTLMVAQPELEVSEDLIPDIKTPSVDYSFTTNGVEIPTSRKDEKEATEFFNNHANYCWDNNRDIVNKTGDPDEEYNWFLGNFEAKRDVKFSKHSYQGVPGTTTNEITKVGWESTQSKLEFCIPINNGTLDGDFSVRRNNHYQIKLKVNTDTYKAISQSHVSSTRSQDASTEKNPLEVSVKVSPLE